MRTKKLVKLINDERDDRNVVADKACDSTSTDMCTEIDYASCTIHSYDICAKDYVSCHANAYDYCTNIDTTVCKSNNYDYN